MNISILGIDLAKNYFQVCGLNKVNKAQFNRKLIRNKYWARKFQEMGHTVRLVPAQHVKPFVKGNKDDRNDAPYILQSGVAFSVISS